ncbi:uncharacterized protein LOC144565592 [Carex rostrata]
MIEEKTLNPNPCLSNQCSGLLSRIATLSPSLSSVLCSLSHTTQLSPSRCSHIKSEVFRCLSPLYCRVTSCCLLGLQSIIAWAASSSLNDSTPLWLYVVVMKEKSGAAICWAQWFPEAARAMALQGLDSCEHWKHVMQGHVGANLFLWR